MKPPETIDTFGAMLKYLRRRARLTQAELGLAVGYNEAHISRLENGQRLPDLAVLAALFVPALDLQDEPGLAARLLELGGSARARPAPAAPTDPSPTIATERFDIVGAIESIPALPPDYVPRAVLAELDRQLKLQRGLVLCGMAGMGKTTLAAALAHGRAPRQPVFWLTFTAGVTDTVEAVLRQLALFALSLGGEQVLPMLSQPEAGRQPLHLDQQLALINRALEGREALLCFDRANLVHADPAILRVFTHLLATSPARLLLTSREELPLPGAAQVRLAGMPPAEAARLVAGLEDRLPSGVAAQLIEKTGGSPMLLRLALSQLRAGRDAAALVAHLESEPEVTAFLIASVLHSLTPGARRLVELLSIFRQPVNLQDDALVARIGHLRGEKLDLGRSILELQQRQLIDQPAAALLHPLVRGHIYAALNADLPRRQALHRLAGEWLAGDPDQFLRAAYHFGRADDLKRAVDLLTDQGQALIERGESETGLQVIDELIGRARRQSDAADLLRPLLTLRGMLLAATVRAAEAEENYREALTLTTQPAPRAHIALSLAGLLIARNRPSEALVLCESIAPGLSDESHLLLSARLASVIAQAELSLSHLPEARTQAECALELAERLRPGLPTEAAAVEAHVQLSLGIIFSLSGQAPAAVHAWQRALVAAHRASLRTVEMRCETNLGIQAYQAGDWAGALEHYQTALLGARALNDSLIEARVWSNIAIVRYIRGELDEALEAAARARALKESQGDLVGVANADNTRASVLLAREDFRQARSLCERTVAQAEDGKSDRLLGGYLDTLALVQLAQGEAAAALDTLKRILSLEVAGADAALMHDVHCHLALVLVALGRLEQAQTELEALAASDDPKHIIERALTEGWLRRARGELPAARAALKTARERVEASGYALYTPGIKRLHRALRSPSRPLDLRF